VKLANDNAAKAGVADRVEAREARPLRDQPRRRDRLTLTLPHTNPARAADLRGDAARLAVVARHPLGPWQPEWHLQFDVPEKVEISGTTRTVLYLYIVPARVGGAWRLELPAAVAKQPARLAFEQHPAGTKGSATIGNRQVALEGVKVAGESVRFDPRPAAGGAARARRHRRGNVIEARRRCRSGRGGRRR
jgi:hypothetical protein